MAHGHSYVIFCDSLQEGMWFQKLHPDFSNAYLERIPNDQGQLAALGLDKLLKYDRPDIIIKDYDQAILVIERTKEVPSGHNVGQRFGRLIGAAEERVPCVYIFPYKAYKHGGDTAGPRYVNLRLFYALEKVNNYWNTVITTINWPVDNQCEVLLTPAKDARLIEYLKMFLSYYDLHGMKGLVRYISNSKFQKEQKDEKITFARTEIKNPQQYCSPPPSVSIMPICDFERDYCSITPYVSSSVNRIGLYYIGMSNIRSDPYAGAAMLYDYLYRNNDLIQILHFPKIEQKNWYLLNQSKKIYRMYKASCEGILFKDGLVMKNNL